MAKLDERFKFLSAAILLLRSLGKPHPSVSNGFEIRYLDPHLADASAVEKRITSMTSLSIPMTVLRAGIHLISQDHSNVMTADSTVIAKRLPQLFPHNSHKFTSVVAAKLTTEQEIDGLRRQSSFVNKISGQLKFYIENNIVHESRGISIDPQAISELQRNVSLDQHDAFRFLTKNEFAIRSG